MRIFFFLTALTMATPLSARNPGEPLATCHDDPGVTLSGTITGYQPGKGVYIALYSSEGDFNNGRYCRNRRFIGADLPRDTISFSFSNLPVGDYLLASYQDIDGDGKMTRGLFGMPKDPYRIHVPNYGLFGPKFANCRFRVDKDYSRAHMDFTKGKK